MASSFVLTGRTAVLVRRAISFAVLVIAALTFAFGFGSGLSLGLKLGTPGWMAPLVAPAVDLTTLVLIVSIQYMRSNGVTNRLLGPRLLLVFAGLTTIVLNIAVAVLEHHYGRAAFDAISPLLLLGWAEVAPGLLALLHGPRQAAGDHGEDSNSLSVSVPEDMDAAPQPTGPSHELGHGARELDAARRASTGRSIRRDVLRAELGISNALAGELLRIVRSAASDGESS